MLTGGEMRKLSNSELLNWIHYAELEAHQSPDAGKRRKALRGLKALLNEYLQRVETGSISGYKKDEILDGST